jgi:dihydroflavonol-4-reductase
LKAAKAAGIKKIVLTSSVAAIGGNWPKDSKRGTSLDEAFNGSDWTKLEGLESTYAESKTRAELAAWDLTKALGLPLSTVHPSFVQGPMLLPRAPTSTALVKRILQGAMPAVPPIGMNICSVTDVAETHVAALRAGEASVGKRYLVTSGNILMTDLAKRVRFAYPTWPVKTLEAPWILMKLYSCFDAQAATVMSSWRKETYYDSAPTAALLGRELADPYEACLEMAKSLVDQGIATRK